VRFFLIEDVDELEKKSIRLRLSIFDLSRSLNLNIVLLTIKVI